jgi:hypothetical protein
MEPELEEEEPSLTAKSTATGSGSPEYSLSTTLPDVPLVSLGALTENVALWTPEQPDRANQPW